MNEILPLSRRDLIEARLLDGRPVVAASLAAEFNISEHAIRRDLRALAAEGKCRRVYGGALPNGLSHPISLRVSEFGSRKTALAKAAAEKVQYGELIFLDSSSTNLAMVSHLPEDANLTLATNAISIAAEALKRTDIRLIIIGGVVDSIVGGAVDALAIDALQSLNIDRCFIGACAVSSTLDLNVHEHADAAFKRHLLKRSRLKSALITNEKFGANAPYRIGTAGNLDDLFIEHGLSSDVTQMLSALEINLVVVNPADGEMEDDFR